MGYIKVHLVEGFPTPVGVNGLWLKRRWILAWPQMKSVHCLEGRPGRRRRQHGPDGAENKKWVENKKWFDCPKNVMIQQSNCFTWTCMQHLWWCRRYEANWIDKTQMSCLPSLLKVFKPNVMGIVKIIQVPSNSINTCLMVLRHGSLIFPMHRFCRSIKSKLFFCFTSKTVPMVKKVFRSFCE